jgi:hypothetical protein
MHRAEALPQNRLYRSTARKPATSKLSLSLSKLGSYVNRAGTLDRMSNMQTWNPQLVEMAMAALQPEMFAAALCCAGGLRSIDIHHAEPLRLPPPHLAQQTAVYLLAIEEDQDESQ